MTFELLNWLYLYLVICMFSCASLLTIDLVGYNLHGVDMTGCDFPSGSINMDEMVRTPTEGWKIVRRSTELFTGVYPHVLDVSNQRSGKYETDISYLNQYKLHNLIPLNIHYGLEGIKPILCKNGKYTGRNLERRTSVAEPKVCVSLQKKPYVSSKK